MPFTEYSPLSLVEQSPYLNQTLIEHPGSRVVAIEASEHLESYRQDPRYHTLRSYVDVGAAARLATPTEVFDTIEVVIHFESSQGADIGRLDEALDGPRACRCNERIVQKMTILLPVLFLQHASSRLRES